LPAALLLSTGRP